VSCRILILFVLAAVSEACQVPVFRYALERWSSQPHGLVVPRGASQPDFVPWMLANLDPVSPGDATATGSWALLPAWPAEQVPWWSGPVPPDLARVVDSPIRRELVRLIGDIGASGVWLIGGGDAAGRDALRALTEARAQHIASAATLPSEDPAAALAAGISPNALRDPTVTTPYQLRFASLTFAADDPAEIFLAAQLGLPRDPTAPLQAWLVYGRGRAIGPFTAVQLTAGTIDNVHAFLVGICSCQVKEGNPGFDLLLSADWDALIRRPRNPAPMSTPAVTPIPPPAMPERASFVPAPPAVAAIAVDRRSWVFIALAIAALGVLGLALARRAKQRS
jgi:hypothetical protein